MNVDFLLFTFFTFKSAYLHFIGQYNDHENKQWEILKYLIITNARCK